MLCKRRISIPHKNDIGLPKINLNSIKQTKQQKQAKKIKVFSNFFLCFELQVYLAV